MFKDIDFPSHADALTSNLAVRAAIYEAYKGECFYSGRKITIDEMVLDHVWPKSKGGPDNYYNYVPTVKRLNGSKLAKFSTDFVRRVYAFTHMVYCVKVTEHIVRNTKPIRKKAVVKPSLSVPPTKRIVFTAGKAFHQILSDIREGVVHIKPCDFGAALIGELPTTTESTFRDYDIGVKYDAINGAYGWARFGGSMKTNTVDGSAEIVLMDPRCSPSEDDNELVSIYNAMYSKLYGLIG